MFCRQSIIPLSASEGAGVVVLVVVWQLMWVVSEWLPTEGDER